MPKPTFETQLIVKNINRELDEYSTDGINSYNYYYNFLYLWGFAERALKKIKSMDFIEHLFHQEPYDDCLFDCSDANELIDVLIDSCKDRKCEDLAKIKVFLKILIGRLDDYLCGTDLKSDYDLVRERYI